MSRARQDMLGVAVVGAGDMGQTHMQHIAEIPWLKIRAVADTDASRAAEQAKRFGGCAWTRVVVEFRSGDVGCFNVCWGLPEGTEALHHG